jgi:hemoglobin
MQSIHALHNENMENQSAGPGLSLYKRIGGYDAIAEIVDELFNLIELDPRFSRFGLGRGTDSKRRVKQLTVEQLCALSGGPCVYLGRDMKTSHAELAITLVEWEANLDLARQVLAKRLGEREQQEFLALFELYRDQVVEVVEAPASSPQA